MLGFGFRWGLGFGTSWIVTSLEKKFRGPPGRFGWAIREPLMALLYVPKFLTRRSQHPLNLCYVKNEQSSFFDFCAFRHWFQNITVRCCCVPSPLWLHPVRPGNSESWPLLCSQFHFDFLNARVTFLCPLKRNTVWYDSIFKIIYRRIRPLNNVCFPENICLLTTFVQQKKFIH